MTFHRFIGDLLFAAMSAPSSVGNLPYHNLLFEGRIGGLGLRELVRLQKHRLTALVAPHDLGSRVGQQGDSLASDCKRWLLNVRVLAWLSSRL